MVKAIILCAGYGTRLGELGERCAKALLDINGRPLIEHLLDRINEIDGVDDIYVVSNNKFYRDFINWREEYGHDRVRVLNDGSTNNENRLGALRDLEFVLGSEDFGDDDFLVIAGDNLMDFSFKDFYSEFREKGENLIAVCDVGDIERVRGKYGVVVLEESGRVVDFQEKPLEPKSTMRSIFCYLFRPFVKGLLGEYLVNGNSDAPGYFIEWLYKRDSVYAHKIHGDVWDIGSIEGLREVRERFG